MAQQVKVIMVPGGASKYVDIEEGSTVGDVLKAAQFDTKGWTIRLNTKPADINDKVQANDFVMMAKEIVGNGQLLVDRFFLL